MLRLFILLIFLLDTALASSLVTNLIEPVGYFSGRNEELKKLGAYLSQYKKASVVGLSGIGKSQLVRKYAYENKENYSLIWFFDSNLNLDRQFSALAREINAKNNNNHNLLLPEGENSKQAILDYISSKKNILIIFDNLKIAHNSIVHDFIKLEHNGHILFCSQDAETLPNVIKLANLSNIESSETIKKIITKRTEYEKQRLNEVLKGYPLLISQAAFLLNNDEYLTIEDYISSFHSNQKMIDDHVNIVLQNLSFLAKSLLYKLILIDQRFSWNCINRINEDTNIYYLQELTRFGLVNYVGLENNIKIFELHDAIKNSLLKNASPNSIVSNIESMITSVHNSLPKRSLIRYKLFLEDSTILNAIERLEQNAILYKVYFYNILTLTRHRLVFSIFSRDNNTLDLIHEWFQSYDYKSDPYKIQSVLHKVSYSECIFMLGLNDFIFKQNVEKGYEQIKLAQNIIEKLPGEENLKISIYGQLAQYYVDIGNLEDADASLKKMIVIKTEYPEIELSLRLYHLINAKIFLNNAQYEKALKEIELCLEQEKNKILLNNTFYTGTYLLQARIFSRMRNYQKAKEISLRIYKQPNFKNQDNDLIALTFIELSNAELGLNENSSVALNFAEQANEILRNNKSRNKDIVYSRDTYLADAIVARANVLSSIGNTQKALEEYLIAEVIYYNKYKLNMKNIDDVSYMYYNAALASKYIDNHVWFTKFRNKHLKYFGPNHKRSKMLDQF